MSSEGPSVRAFWHALPNGLGSGSVASKTRALAAAALHADTVMLYGGRVARDACPLTTQVHLHLPDLAWSEHQRASGGMGLNRVGAAFATVAYGAAGRAHVLVGNIATDELALAPRPATVGSRPGSLDVFCLYGACTTLARVTLLGDDEALIPCARVGCAIVSQGQRIFYFGGIAGDAAGAGKPRGGGGGGGAPTFLGDLGYLSWRDSKDDPTSARPKRLGVGDGGVAVVEGAAPAARAFATLTLVGDSMLVLAGGLGDAGPLGDVHVLNYKGKNGAIRWSQPVLHRGPLPLPRSHHCALALEARDAAAVGAARSCSILIYGGCADESALLHAEVLDLSGADLGSLTVTRSGTAGWSHGSRRTADTWVTGAGGGPRSCSAPSPRLGAQQVVLPIGASAPVPLPISAGTFAASLEERLREAMLAADAAAAPDTSKRARGGGGDGGGRRGGEPEWVERALRASTVALVLGGGSIAGGGSAAGSALSLSMADDMYLLQLVPTGEVPARILAEADAAAASAAAPRGVATTAAAEGASTTGRKRSAAVAASTTIAAAAPQPPPGRAKAAGDGASVNDFSSTREAGGGRSVGGAAAAAPPDPSASLQAIMGLLGQLVAAQAVATTGAGGGGVSLPPHVQVQTQQVRLDASSLQGVTTAAADAVASAVTRLGLASKVDVEALQTALFTRVQHVQQAATDLSRTVESSLGPATEAARSTDGAIKGLREAVDSIGRNFDGERGRLAARVAALEGNLEVATAKLTAHASDMAKVEAEKAARGAELERLRHDIEKERERMAASHSAAERAGKAAEDRAAAARMELEQARKEIQLLRDERATLLVRLRRVEDALKGS